eukprot:Rhum_TRINITY_DN24849_c0_g1::Rhum_TRINITY_DN24849_c0_g1_i1::g.180276::m.180276
MYGISLVRSNVRISGFDVTACSSAGRLSAPLYWKSPKPRDTASWPFTRGTPPASCTFEPAASMRFCSSGAFGLWSSDSSTVLPPCDITARESPAFAQCTLFLLWSTTTTVAVEPACRPAARIAASSLRKAGASAASRLPSFHSGSAVSASRRCSAAYAATSWPEWPSNTPYTPTPGPALPPGSSAMCASSMDFLQPCISTVVTMRSSLDFSSTCFSRSAFSRKSAATAICWRFSISTNCCICWRWRSSCSAASSLSFLICSSLALALSFLSFVPDSFEWIARFSFDAVAWLSCFRRSSKSFFDSCGWPFLAAPPAPFFLPIISAGSMKYRYCSFY